jgi:signal transduction histidine kinase
VRTEISDAGPLPANVESELFRIAGEALTNVRKHAGAREASLRLDMVRGRLRLTVADAGAGFRMRGARRRGFGLMGIEDRARLVGGRATIRSTPGRGTTVTVTVPLVEK